MAMRISVIMLAVAMSCGSVCAQDAVMGNYEGLWQMEGTERQIVAQVIAEGNDTYRAVLKEAFYTRAGPIIELKGKLTEDVAKLEGEGGEGPAKGTRWVGEISVETFAGRITGDKTGEFAMKKVVLESPMLGLLPPPGAVVLFDGDNLDQWRNKKWKLIEGDAMQVNGGSNSSRARFRDHRIHIEFKCPLKPKARGQGRGNSGVYVQGKFEVQVLDSFGLEGKANECGGVYKYAQPRVNAAAPPLQWQTYDIFFRAARYNDDNKLTEPPRITVLHNGIVIHNSLRVRGARKDPGPLNLQDHGNPVQYRNIWVMPLN